MRDAFLTDPSAHCMGESEGFDCVIIKGKGGSAKHALAEYLEQFPHAELWTLNDDRHPLATRHFEMHRPRHHITLDLEIPVIVHWNALIDVDNEEPFPFVEMRERYPWAQDCTAMPAYMLAYAALHGARHVCFPGVDFSGNLAEFTEQRISCEKWCHVLMGQGTQLHIPEDSALLKRIFYYS